MGKQRSGDLLFKPRVAIPNLGYEQKPPNFKIIRTRRWFLFWQQSPMRAVDYPFLLKPLLFSYIKTLQSGVYPVLWRLVCDELSLTLKNENSLGILLVVAQTSPEAKDIGFVVMAKKDGQRTVKYCYSYNFVYLSNFFVSKPVNIATDKWYTILYI